jgi:hypothetical protein
MMRRECGRAAVALFGEAETALERSRAANSPVSGRCPPLASIRPWLWGAGWDACTDVESVGFGSGRGCLVIGADAGERRNDRRADRDGGQPCQKLSNGHAAAHPTAPAWDTQNGAPRLLVALALQEVHSRRAISPKSGIFRNAAIAPGTSRFGTRRALLTRSCRATDEGPATASSLIADSRAGLRLDGPGVNGVA